MWKTPDSINSLVWKIAAGILTLWYLNICGLFRDVTKCDSCFIGFNFIWWWHLVKLLTWLLLWWVLTVVLHLIPGFSGVSPHFTSCLLQYTLCFHMWIHPLTLPQSFNLFIALCLLPVPSQPSGFEAEAELDSRIMLSWLWPVQDSIIGFELLYWEASNPTDKVNTAFKKHLPSVFD